MKSRWLRTVASCFLLLAPAPAAFAAVAATGLPAHEVWFGLGGASSPDTRSASSCQCRASFAYVRRMKGSCGFVNRKAAFWIGGPSHWVSVGRLKLPIPPQHLAAFASDTVANRRESGSALEKITGSHSAGTVAVAREGVVRR